MNHSIIVSLVTVIPDRLQEARFAVLIKQEGKMSLYLALFSDSRLGYWDKLTVFLLPDKSVNTNAPAGYSDFFLKWDFS